MVRETTNNHKVTYTNGETDEPDEAPQRRRRGDGDAPIVPWRWIAAVLGALGLGGGGATVINTPWVLKSEAAEEKQAAKESLAEHAKTETSAREKLESKVDEVRTDVKEVLREMRRGRR